MVTTNRDQNLVTFLGGRIINLRTWISMDPLVSSLLKTCEEQNPDVDLVSGLRESERFRLVYLVVDWLPELSVGQ